MHLVAILGIWYMRAVGWWEKVWDFVELILG